MVHNEGAEGQQVPKIILQFAGRQFEHNAWIPAQKIRDFLEKVNFVESGCWEWTAAQRHGYGLFWWMGSNVTAHRFAWLAFVGALDQHRHVHHKCENTCCVNPEHLEPLFPGDHVRDFTPNNPVYKNVRKEFCINGHPLSGDNVRIATDPDGTTHRRCKTCLRDWAREKYQKDNSPRERTVATCCRNGHEFTPENTYEWRGIRQCRTCHNENSSRSYAKLKAAPPKPEKTHCVHGHPWITENLDKRLLKSGKVEFTCAVCRREKMNEKYAAKRAKKLEEGATNNA